MSWLNRLFNNNRFLMVLSLVLAVIIWFTVAIVYSPQTNKSITGVSVDVSFDAKGRYQVYYPEGFVTKVEVKGKKYVVKQLDAESLKITANVGTVTSAGTYTLDLSVEEGDFSVVSLSPSTINVLVDVPREKQIPVEIAPIPAKLAQRDGENENLLLETAFANEANKTVTLSGPETQLNKVASAKVVAQGVNENEELSGSKLYTADLVLYDANGNELFNATKKTNGLQYVTLSYEQTEVVANVTLTKEVPLQCKFEGGPANPSVTLREITGSQASQDNAVSTVKIKGPVEVLDGVEYIQLDGVVDYSKIVPGDSSSYEFKLQLPQKEGITYYEYANVSDLYFLAIVDSQGLYSQHFDVPATDVKVTNVLAGHTATVRSALKGITVLGPAACVSTITPADLSVEVDASSVTAATTQELKAVITVKTQSACWVVGEYHVVVEVVKN